jgi:hypothetical protein
MCCCSTAPCWRLSLTAEALIRLRGDPAMGLYFAGDLDGFHRAVAALGLVESDLAAYSWLGNSRLETTGPSGCSPSRPNDRWRVREILVG